MATQQRISRSLYRALLREAKRFDASDHPLRLPFPMPLPVVVTRYGRGSYSGQIPAQDLQSSWFPKLKLADISREYATSTTFSGQELKKIIRHTFQKGKDLGLSVDDGLMCLSTLNRIRALSPTHTVTTTNHTSGTQVTVELGTAFIGYLPEHVLEQAGHWPFAYRVRVNNTGNKVVQLLSRHWIFESEDGGMMEVPKGSTGVVGHAPVLEPGQAFEYYSGTQLTSPRGWMSGSFTMVVGATDERFEAQVLRTELMAPSTKGVNTQAAAGEQSKAKASP